MYQGQLIEAAVPLHEGIDDGDFINGPFDHMAYWETVRRTIPALRTVEYDAVPRGRVLYRTAEGRGYVYMEQVLHRRAGKALIRPLFELPGRTPLLLD